MAVRGELPLAEQANKYDVHATQISQLKAGLLKGAEAVFEGSRADKPDPPKFDTKCAKCLICVDQGLQIATTRGSVALSWSAF